MNIFTLVGFKVTWLSCVFGELYFNSWVGFVIGITYLIIFFINVDNKYKSFRTILFFSFSGYIFDSALSFFELYTIEAQTTFLYLPIWFIVLWPSFACLLIKVLSFLKNYNLLSAILGALIGPISYYAGITLGLANVTNNIIFIVISFFWFLLMFYYSKYTLSKN
jgi:hypothetical protein